MAVFVSRDSGLSQTIESHHGAITAPWFVFDSING